MRLLAAQTPDLDSINSVIDIGEGLVWGGIISAISMSIVFTIDKTLTYFEKRDRERAQVTE